MDYSLMPEEKVESERKCSCDLQGECVFLADAPPTFRKTLRKLEVGNWTELFGCVECGNHWAIDAFEKYGEQVVAHVVTTNEWHAASEHQRKLLLLKARGGEVSGICVWRGCAKRLVANSAYGLDHLYKTGTRR